MFNSPQTESSEASQKASVVSPGTLIKKRYRVIGRIGSGTFGQVFKVMDRASGIDKALKFFTSTSVYEEIQEIMLTKELSEHDTQHRVAQNGVWALVQTMSAHHTFQELPIRKKEGQMEAPEVKCFEHFMHGSLLGFVMELEPYNLLFYQRLYYPDGLTPKTVRSVAFTLLAGLAYLKERKVIHCDIKPNNILLTDNGTRSVIADFGNACKSVSGRLVKLNKRQNIKYRAPEIILQYKTHHALDMWNAGRSLVEILLPRSRVPPCYIETEAINKLCQWLGDPPLSCMQYPIYFSERFCRSLKMIEEKIYRPSLKTALLTETHARIERQFSQPEELVETMVLHDLLKRMMQWEPASRLTPNEARQHKFFSCTWTTVAEQKPIWIEKIRHYHKMHQIQVRPAM